MNNHLILLMDHLCLNYFHHQPVFINLSTEKKIKQLFNIKCLIIKLMRSKIYLKYKNRGTYLSLGFFSKLES